MTRAVPHPCQFPGCENLKVPGRGVRYCSEHAYQHLRTDCWMPDCPEPKLVGRFRYCAKHSSEVPQRERIQLVRRKREREYGITHDEYVALFEAQGGACAICGNAEDSKIMRQLSVDHDHKTGEIRGLLCSRCNPMLGYARDSVAILRAAIAYLGTPG